MSLSGSQRYNFEELRKHINNALLNEQMPDKLYKSVDGFLRIITAILITTGDNWAAQVLDENGKPLLTTEEQAKFTDVFKPYTESIINFFNSNTSDDEMVGGTMPVTVAPVTVAPVTVAPVTVAPVISGMGDMYSKIMKRINSIDTRVNEYASNYGILKLEKDYDI